MKDTIYVVIPAYNVDKYLAITFNSLLGQTYTDWVCLCMDDGSTDETFKVMQQFAEKDKRFKIFTQKNQGVTKTLNTLLDKVEGPYLYYLDSDDYIHPKTFETLMYFMHKTNADVVECGIKRVYAENPEDNFDDFNVSDVSSMDIPDMNVFLTRKTQIGAWANKVNKLYRWDAVKNVRFSELLSYEEDYFYGMQINNLIKKKIIIEKLLYFYRLNPASMCHTLNTKRYQSAAINRVKLSYDYFIKGNRVPDKYLEDFKTDLANDAYRMIVRKALKKCKDGKLRKELFVQGSKAFKDYIDNNVVEIKRLPFLKRLTALSYAHGLYFISRILVYIA